MGLVVRKGIRIYHCMIDMSANRENPPPSDFPRAFFGVVFLGNQIAYTLQNDFRKLLPSPQQISLVANPMLRKKAIFKKKGYRWGVHHLRLPF